MTELWKNNEVMELFNNKAKRIVASVIAILLVIAMVVPMMLEMVL